MSEKKEFTLSTPAAIIVGAIIVGIAIVFAFSNRVSSPENTEYTDDRPTIEEAAKEVGINKKDLALCIQEDRHGETIAAQMENATAVGFQGTPHSIVISNTTGKKFSLGGARPIEQWREIITIIDNEDFQPAEDDLASNIAPVTENDHKRGSEEPRVTIVEYSDIDCPFCARLHETMIDVLAEYDDVQWVYRHMPIAGLHPEAYEKALASECVYELSNQDDMVFWEYLDLLFGIK